MKAVAVGMFDGVHLGHQALVRELGECARLRGLSTCILTFADHPLRTICPQRAPKLLTASGQKIEYLLEAGADHALALRFDDDLRRLTAREFMRKISGELGVGLWMLGFNHRFGSDGLKHFEEYAAIGRELGIEMVQAHCEVIEGMDRPVSSSIIRQALENGEAREAAMMLGRPFSIVGTVEAGCRIGRTIGFPTANVKPLIDDQLIPKRGAYACTAIIDGQEWKAMTNIGVRPTIGDGLSPTIETHVIGFEGNLYGKSMEVRFIRRLRDERRFSSLAELQSQLNHDLLQCIGES